MICLQLIPGIHKQLPSGKASFACYWNLMALVRHQKGVSLILIQILLGYNRSKTSERYTQVSTQEIENIVNPLDSYYQKKSGTIHAKMGCIVPLKQRDKENKHHKGVYSK
jgi:hypothetical protein